jgi:hypothetical protein
MEPSQMKMKVNIQECPDVVCSEPDCGCKFFIAALRVKKISMLLSQSGKEEMHPIQSFVCFKCGKELEIA